MEACFCHRIKDKVAIFLLPFFVFHSGEKNIELQGVNSEFKEKRQNCEMQTRYCEKEGHILQFWLFLFDL